MDTGRALKQDARVGRGYTSARNGANPLARVCFGVFQLDLQQKQLFRDGLRVNVQGKVYQALVALVETPGELVTREALRTRLWPRDTRLNCDANVNTTVNKLRQVLGDTNEESKYIETIPRKGYSFVAKVNYVKRAEHATSNWKFLNPPNFLSSGPARVWFTASVIALLMAAILFGAAVTLYSHRSVQHGLTAHPDAQQHSKP
jgi:DNA-binding winged helix-turn-helix (wHTH) protein